MTMEQAESRHHRRLILAWALVMATVAGMIGLSTTIRAEGTPVEPTWEVCPTDVAAANPTLRCATVPVPLDHDDPDGPQIDIAVSRLSSTAPDKRRGVLLTNPGGPGSPGLTMPADLVTRGLPASISAAYDIIGVDPRGVGRSAPVSCGFTLTSPYIGNVPPYAVDDTTAVQAHAEVAAQVARDCAERDAEDRLRHISTLNTARDLDLIRVALGEEKVSYLGTSYGSALGAAYASMFPDRTDRVVLDSNVGSTHIDHDAVRRYGQGVEETFGGFARWAAARDDAYGLGSSPHQVRRTYLRLAEELDTQPVNGYTGATFRFATFVGLYSPTKYPTIAQLWQTLDSAPASVPTPPTPTPPTPEPDLTTPSPQPPELAPFDNPWAAYLAVTCNDSDWSENLADYQRAVAEDRKRHPLYGPAAANVNPCAFWPTDPAEPPARLDDEGPANILLVQNRYDPATPWSAAKALREELPQRSRLVTVQASGHGVYVYGDNACALNTTTRFLLGGDIPVRDTLCRP